MLRAAKACPAFLSVVRLNCAGVLAFGDEVWNNDAKQCNVDDKEDDAFFLTNTFAIRGAWHLPRHHHREWR